MIMHWDKCNLERQVKLTRLREVGGSSEGYVTGKTTPGGSYAARAAKAGMASAEWVIQAKWQSWKYIQFWNKSEARPNAEWGVRWWNHLQCRNGKTEYLEVGECHALETTKSTVEVAWRLARQRATVSTNRATFCHACQIALNTAGSK